MLKVKTYSLKMQKVGLQTKQSSFYVILYIIMKPLPLHLFSLFWLLGLTSSTLCLQHGGKKTFCLEHSFLALKHNVAYNT